MIDLRLGDCLDILPTLADKSVDAIITDLPYGTTACKWDVIIPLDKMWAQVKRLCKGAFVTTASQPFTSVLIVSNLEWFKYEWVWDKRHGANFMQGNKRPINNIEDVAVFYNGHHVYNPQKTPNPRGTETRNKHKASKQKSVFAEQVSTTKLYTSYSPNYEPDKLLPKAIISFSRDAQPVHPTQKPVALYEYLIKTYTNPGDTVLDFCAGSGTTGVAAIRTGRNAILIEREPEYFAVMERRIHEAQQMELV
jgi:site-specific DNA-methyltransferase (adenine-specific)